MLICFLKFDFMSCHIYIMVYCMILENNGNIFIIFTRIYHDFRYATDIFPRIGCICLNNTLGF